jgi:aryl-alcohol dehydrogenase-like predicted oxidoreductase
VPLASGLLSGKMSKDMTFGEGDHRHFNREGEAFDKGETFSGVEFEKGIDAVEELRTHFDENHGSLAQWAIRWVLMFPAVSTVIPGASSVEHALDNAAASELPPLSSKQMDAVKQVYNEYFRSAVHHRW